MSLPSLPVGSVWRHYKGGLYTVIGVARHTETDEVLVIYLNAKHGTLHARPITVWFTPSTSGEIRFDRVK